MKSRRVSIEPNMPMSKHSPPMDSRSWEGVLDCEVLVMVKAIEVVLSYGFPFWSAVAQGAPVFDVGHVGSRFLVLGLEMLLDSFEVIDDCT